MSVLIETVQVVFGAVVEWLPFAPDPGGGEPPPGSEKFLTMLRWAAWIASGVCVLGVIVAGAAMAMAHRGHGGGGEHATRLGWVLAGCIVIGAASGLVGALI